MTTDEAIRVLECGGWWDLLDSDGSDADLNPLHEALDVALSALRAQQTAGWISVKDRLPKKDEEVLVCVAGVGYGIAYWWDTGEPEWSYTGLGEEAPTHWQPLPEPPKG